MKMRFFGAGVFVGLIIVPLVVWLYFVGGFAPVATSADPMPFEKRLARRALHARIEREMPKSAGAAPTEENLLAGATIYKAQCAVCHGLPKQEETKIAAGMYPPPPQLYGKHGVEDDPAEETYWKVANGIRLTGMPSYNKTLKDLEMWQVSVLLAKGHDLPASVTDALAAP